MGLQSVSVLLKRISFWKEKEQRESQAVQGRKACCINKKKHCHVMFILLIMLHFAVGLYCALHTLRKADSHAHAHALGPKSTIDSTKRRFYDVLLTKVRAGGTNWQLLLKHVVYVEDV
jgi:hypothetical protein